VLRTASFYGTGGVILAIAALLLLVGQGCMVFGARITALPQEATWGKSLAFIGLLLSGAAICVGILRIAVSLVDVD